MEVVADFADVSRAGSSRLIVSMTAMATAQASGPPPKVVPCMPGVKARRPRSVQSIAPMGMPPAIGLARVVTSGRMP